MSVQFWRGTGSEASTARWLGLTVLGVGLWLVVYRQLEPFSSWFVGRLPIERGSHLFSC